MVTPMATEKSPPRILAAADLDLLIQALRSAGYRVVGPVLADQAIVYDEIAGADDLPQGWTDEQEKGFYRLMRRHDPAYFGYAVGPHSWKKYLHPPRRQVWRAHQSNGNLEIELPAEDSQATAFLGVRSCELHAIAIQDRVFLTGRYPNGSYQNRRQKVFTVSVNCTSAAATCFCQSMNTGPAVGLDCDLEMTEIVNAGEHYFLVRSGSDSGEAILKQLPLLPATADQTEGEAAAIDNAVQQMKNGPRSFDSSDLQSLLYRNYDSPAWDQVADRCLSCANCTMACPTCFCTTVEDTTDLSGQHAERWERWDSCFTGDFSHVHGGAIRPGTRSRYRQWLTHKLATWIDQFGSSGCVGCGRCIAWCPVGIDLTEEVKRIRELEQS